MAQCRIGVGLRPTHYPYLKQRPRTLVTWFEAISENYMDSKGRPLRMLEFMRKDYPVALHGVSMSLGSAEGVRPDYLKRLKTLAERIDPFIVSDHLCWTRSGSSSLHDLLPLPYTDKTLRLLARNIGRVQDLLGRPLVVENVSAYLTYKESTYTEWDFLTALCRSSGCKLLLDVNNGYVNAANHGFDPLSYLDAIPSEHVAQIHLAGFTDMGTHLFDTHSKPVDVRVWDLYLHVIKRLPDVPVLIEWDEDIPEFPVVEAEAAKAKEGWETYHGRAPALRETTPHLRSLG